MTYPMRAPTPRAKLTLLIAAVEVSYGAAAGSPLRVRFQKRRRLVGPATIHLALNIMGLVNFGQGAITS